MKNNDLEILQLKWWVIIQHLTTYPHFAVQVIKVSFMKMLQVIHIRHTIFLPALIFAIKDGIGKQQLSDVTICETVSICVYINS